MGLAIKEAMKAFKEDEVPVGAVIVLDDKVIAKAHNSKIKKNDPTCHAEIECIKKACKKLNSCYIENGEMYVTLEPCLMCAGAIINSRLNKVYIGTLDNKGGSFVSSIELKKVKGLNHYPKYEINIRGNECSKILKDFFKTKRLPRK